MASLENGQMQPRDRIIKIEGTTQHIPSFVINQVSTVQEVIKAVYEKYPHLCDGNIGLLVANGPIGTKQRIVYEDDLPYEREGLWVSLFMRRHPKIEVIVQ